MKPCPFCGGTEIDREGTVTELRGNTAYQATCGKCQSTGPAAIKPRGAEIKWNTRAERTPEEDAKDAQRYRFLRDTSLLSEDLSDPSPYCVRPEGGTGKHILCGDDELDALIDAALNEPSGVDK